MIKVMCAYSLIFPWELVGIARSFLRNHVRDVAELALLLLRTLIQVLWKHPGSARTGGWISFR